MASAPASKQAITRGSSTCEPGQGGGAAHEPAGDRGRDDVGRLAAVGDDAVHLVAGAELLAQQADGHLGDGHGVAGVDPLPRARPRRGRSLPVKVTSKWETARQVRLEPVGRPRVDHHRRVDVVEDPALEHGDLAPATLLGRGAEHPDGEPELVGHAGQAQSGPDRRRRR